MITTPMTGPLTGLLDQSITGVRRRSGSPAFDPASLITESSDFLTTEAGDQLTTEG